MLDIHSDQTQLIKGNQGQIKVFTNKNTHIQGYCSLKSARENRIQDDKKQSCLLGGIKRQLALN